LTGIAVREGSGADHALLFVGISLVRKKGSLFYRDASRRRPRPAFSASGRENWEGAGASVFRAVRWLVRGVVVRCLGFVLVGGYRGAKPRFVAGHGREKRRLSIIQGHNNPRPDASDGFGGCRGSEAFD